MKKQPAYLTIKDLDRTAAVHTQALKQYDSHLTAGKDKLRQGIEAYVEARLASPESRMSDLDFEKLLGDLEAAFNHVASDAAAEGYILGRLPGFRLGFELAGLMHMDCTPTLPYIEPNDLPTFLALAMVEDIHAGELVKAMLEHKGECEAE